MFNVKQNLEGIIRVNELSLILNVLISMFISCHLVCRISSSMLNL